MRQPVIIPGKLPKFLKGEIQDFQLSLAIDLESDYFAVIEITDCVEEESRGCI
jgi:hypothetical protein